MNLEQLQYACDLVNRSVDRTDAAQMKCKVGKPCNGRCIPQNHKCFPSGAARLAVGAVAGAGALAAAHAYQVHGQNKRAAEAQTKKAAERATDKQAAESAKAKRQADGEAFDRERKAKQEEFKTQYGHYKESVEKQSPPTDWDKTLGVSKDASASQVKKAYRDLSRKHHPDKGGNAETFSKINAAYEASKRKDATDQWQSIEVAYKSAQQYHSRVSADFWAL